jgi:PAS domain S-box-containing protein
LADSVAIAGGVELLDQLHDAAMVTSADLDPPGPVILFVNAAFSEMTGYSSAEVVGKTPRLLQGPATERAVLDRLRERLTAGEPFIGSTINYRKDGTPFEIEWSVTPVRDAAGAVDRFVAIQRDVTERRVRELAHSETDQVWQLAQRMGRLGYWETYFADARPMVRLSAGLREIIGAPPDEMSLDDLRSLMLGQESATAVAAVRDAVVRRAAFELEVTIARPVGGSLCLLVRGEPVSRDSAGGAHFIGVARDVTDTRQAMLRLVEAEARFRGAAEAKLDWVLI